MFKNTLEQDIVNTEKKVDLNKSTKRTKNVNPYMDKLLKNAPIKKKELSESIESLNVSSESHVILMKSLSKLIDINSKMEAQKKSRNFTRANEIEYEVIELSNSLAKSIVKVANKFQTLNPEYQAYLLEAYSKSDFEGIRAINSTVENIELLKNDVKAILTSINSNFAKAKNTQSYQSGNLMMDYFITLDNEEFEKIVQKRALMLEKNIKQMEVTNTDDLEKKATKNVTKKKTEAA